MIRENWGKHTKRKLVLRTHVKGPSVHCGVREVVLEEREFKLRSEAHESINQVEEREWGLSQRQQAMFLLE